MPVSYAQMAGELVFWLERLKLEVVTHWSEILQTLKKSSKGSQKTVTGSSFNKSLKNKCRHVWDALGQLV